MHLRAEDLEGFAAAPAQHRRLAAVAAALTAALAPAGAAAEPEPLRPAVVRHGWRLELTGYLQADSIAWAEDSIDELDPSTGDPLNEQRLLIRRGRLRAEARRDGLSGAVELDGNTIDGATARLLGAQVGWQLAARDAPAGPPLLAVVAGLFKTPFGIEVPASERDKPFLEAPAFARALFPGNYDAGVLVHGGFGLVRWSIAAMNGAPVGDVQWLGRDPVASYDLIGRLGAAVDGPRRLRIEAGVSAITGSGLHAGTPPTKDDIQWVDDNQNGIVESTEIQVIPGSPGQPSQRYDRDALGADLTVHWCVCRLGEGAAYAEAVIATNLDRGLVYADPIASSRDVRQLGVSLGVVQDVGRHVQAGVRYDRYDADRDAAERQGIDLVNVHKVFSTLAVMAAARYRDARLLVQYDRERNPFGRGDDGAPATRSADRVTVRAQVGF